MIRLLLYRFTYTFQIKILIKNFVFRRTAESLNIKKENILTFLVRQNNLLLSSQSSRLSQMGEGRNKIKEKTNYV